MTINWRCSLYHLFSPPKHFFGALTRGIWSMASSLSDILSLYLFDWFLYFVHQADADRVESSRLTPKLTISTPQQEVILHQWALLDNKTILTDMNLTLLQAERSTMIGGLLPSVCNSMTEKKEKLHHHVIGQYHCSQFIQCWSTYYCIIC